ncbi:MAG: transposase [Elusimicrobiota bacterium]|nr:transposase [Elusimicrobiota bacterium]
MPRELRVHEEDMIYHAMSRGVEKRIIYLSDEDRVVFLRFLRESVFSARASLFAYCLMGNHFHILIAVRDVPLSVIMHRLLTRYSRYFNDAHDRVGHLFQGRYGAEPCEDLAYLIHLHAYIHRNPVRASLVRQINDWPWSGHEEILAGEGPLLDPARRDALTGFDAGEFKARYLERLGDTTAAPSRETLADTVRRCAAEHGVRVGELLSGMKGARFTLTRAAVVLWADEAGLADAAIAAALNCTPAAVRQLRHRSCHNRA